MIDTSDTPEDEINPVTTSGFLEHEAWISKIGLGTPPLRVYDAVQYIGTAVHADYGSIVSQ